MIPNENRRDYETYDYYNINYSLIKFKHLD